MARTLILGLLLTLGAPAAADPLNGTVDRLMRRYAGDRVPGAAVLVFQGGKVRVRKAYGMADLSNGVRVTPQTRFRLASLSKAFTALSIGILHDQGRLSLNDPVTKHVPELPGWASRITLRHLVHHRSGLPDYEGRIPSSFPRQISDLDVVKILARQSGTTFRPGSRYAYSNAGYAVLSVVAERASALPYPEFVRRAVFAPLGMGAVVYREGHNTVEHRAYGHSRSGGGYRRTDQSRTSAVNGDGSVYASIDDLALWAKALDEMWLVSEQGRPHLFHAGPDGGSYGFGWQLGARRGQRLVSHTGSTIGFRSAIEHYPESDLTVVVLVNRADAQPWNAARQIAEAALNAPSTTPPTTPITPQPPATPITPQPPATPTGGLVPRLNGMPLPAPKRTPRFVVDLPLGD